MNTTDTLTIAPRGERDIVITRMFDATPERVYRAFTTPALLRRWLGPRTWAMEVCDIDLRPGGAWRYEMAGPDGAHMVISGVYREVVPPRRLVTTENFDDDWTGGETVVTTTFDPLDGGTAVTIVVEHVSREARDAALGSGMEVGMAEGYQRLDDLLGAA
jgi:uncharacterized protein YndB with AHSA1/START domain